ncbi:MAG: DUF1194 domain-containing protein [Rhodospirillaceae bacterium]
MLKRSRWPLAWVLVSAFWLAAAPEGSAQTGLLPVDAELVLAADGSGSIDDAELRLQREGYAAAITNPRFLEAVASGYHGKVALAFMEWGGPESQHTIVDWMVIDGPKSAQAFAAKLLSEPRAAFSYNSISEAIIYSINLINTNAYAGKRRIVDVSADGPQMNGRPMAYAHAMAQQYRVIVNGLVVNSHAGFSGPTSGSLDQHFKNDIIFGPGAFVTVAEGRDDFARAILKKMILEIAYADPGHGRRPRR